MHEAAKWKPSIAVSTQIKDYILPLKAPHTDINPAQIVFIFDLSPMPQWTWQPQIPAPFWRKWNDVLAMRQCGESFICNFDPDNHFLVLRPCLSAALVIKGLQVCQQSCILFVWSHRMDTFRSINHLLLCANTLWQGQILTSGVDNRTPPILSLITLCLSIISDRTAAAARSGFRLQELLC